MTNKSSTELDRLIRQQEVDDTIFKLQELRGELYRAFPSLKKRENRDYTMSLAPGCTWKRHIPAAQ